MARIVGSLADPEDKEAFQVWIDEVTAVMKEYAKYNFYGSGSPEGVVVAPLGAIYHNKSGGANTSIYVKETETKSPDSSGWTAK